LNPAITPVLTNPGNKTGTVGVATSLQLVATDPNNDELGYGASGLPTGLTLNALTGAISGTPTVAGNYNVVVAASDGVNTATQSFQWTISDPQALIVNPPPPPATLLSAAQARTQSASRTVRTRRCVGTSTTARRSRPIRPDDVNHTFTHPGCLFVTVTAIDDRNVPVSQTFVQTVHLPLTANRPTGSSTVAWEPRAAGNRAVGRQPGQRHCDRLQRRHQREGR
jgi:hypothetical protein